MAIYNQYNENYQGNWVRVRTTPTNPTAIGILQDADFESITLQPSLIDETLDNNKLELRLQTEKPTIVSMPVDRVEPLNKSYVEELLKKYPVKHDDNQLELF